MADRIIPRHDTMARWAEVNPVLMEGEWGIVIDKLSLYKVGDGQNRWNDLPFRGYDGTIVQNEGNSTRSVMSQNAVTTRLASANANIAELQTDVAARYTKQEVDAKENKLREDVDAEYAKKDGAYPKFTAGFAENIVGDGSATPEVFTFRPTAGEERNVENTTILYDGAKNGEARIKKIKGNSVVFNQQAQQSYFISNSASGTTLTYLSDGSIKVDVKAGISNGGLTSNKLNIVLGHKYFVGLDLTSAIELKYSCLGQSLGNITSSRYDIVDAIKSTIIIYTTRDVDFSFTAKLIIVDLTQMFGADKEPRSEAEFYERLPKGVDINAYNKGEIVDGNYGVLKTTGYNQWDEQWEKGYYDSSTGLPVKSDVITRSKNYNRILPNTKYFCKSPDYIGNDARIFFYTQTKEFIKSESFHKKEITTPSGAYYFHLKFGSFSNNVTTYNNDVCISLAWDEYADMQGLYLPYKSFVRDLSWINKYFPATINGETKYGMRSAGSVHDEIRFNSSTQKWEAAQKVGVRAYAEGDNENPTVITDGTNTNYPLSTPIVTEIDENVNFNFDCADYGTEELIVAEGEKSAPLSAEIIYHPNAVQTLKQVPDILRRLNALESVMAQQITNVEPSNVEE